MLPKFTDLMSDQFYKDLVKSELTKDESEDDEQFYDINELEEVFADHILMGKRLQKTLYRGNIEDLDEDTDHPPIALTGLALKLFSKAAPNYGLDLLDMDYVSSVTEFTRVSPCAMILALIYLERLQLKNTDYLESVTPSGLFVVTMLVASKFLFEDEDDIVTNQIWAELLNMDVKELNHLEQNFLAAIDWKLYVKTSEYFQYLSDIEKMIAIQQSSLRGWFSYSDAYSILQDVAVKRFLLACIERIVKISIVSTFGYAVTVLSVLAAGFALQNRCSKTAASKESTLLKTDSTLQMSLHEISKVELPSEVDLPMEGTTDIEPILDKLSLSIKNLKYKDQDFRNRRHQQTNLFSNLKLSTLICSSTEQYKLQKMRAFFDTNLSNGSIENKELFVNHTHYTLQLWPLKFKNSCIPVLIY